MKHVDCKNFCNLDVDKGMCALTKGYVPIDGEGSDACERFVQMEKCGNCSNFSEPDKYGIGTCSGFKKKDWAYATCGASTCPEYAK